VPSETSSTLPLGDQIRAQIRAGGPMSVSTYMRLCLTHPTEGYYAKSDPLGAAGDFVTAPEISQMFGELIGAWALMHWHVLGKPESFDLVELGPGRGTLMADALRMMTQDPEVMAAMRLVLVENSPALIAQQRERLGQHDPVWVTEIADLDRRQTPLIVIANEFFDTLPIKQYQFLDGHWHERLIGIDDADNLVWGLSETPIAPDTVPGAITAPQDNEICEIAPLAQSTIGELARVLNRRGGGMIAIDYGYTATRTGDTIQAVRNHAPVDPLAHPGNADLTAHVDFEALMNAARAAGAMSQMAGTQGEVLTELGIRQRAETLKATNPERAGQIDNDLDRLIGADRMGDLFKVMVVFGGEPAAPFETDPSLARIDGVRHGFFGRQGGISTGVHAGLNVSYMTEDDPENVTQNRRAATEALGLPDSSLVTVRQVHSATVVTIDESFDPESRPEADGMVTDRPGLTLGILTADCTPVLFADPDAGVIGACHAGWRGAVDGVVANTVEAMKALGAEPARIVAAIGPVIHGADYEVGPEFARDVLARYPDAAPHVFRPSTGAKEHFDLPGFVVDRLRAAGIERIGRVGQSTYARPDVYFSHRYATHRSIAAGRQISLIART